MRECKYALSVLRAAVQRTYCCSQVLPQGKQRWVRLGNEARGKTKHTAFLFQMQHTSFRTRGGQQPRWGWPALTVHGHLVYLGGVVLLNVSQDADVIILHKVDCYTFSAISA